MCRAPRTGSRSSVERDPRPAHQEPGGRPASPATKANASMKRTIGVALAVLATASVLSSCARPASRPRARRRQPAAEDHGHRCARQGRHARRAANGSAAPNGTSWSTPRRSASSPRGSPTSRASGLEQRGHAARGVTDLGTRGEPSIDAVNALGLDVLFVTDELGRRCDGADRAQDADRRRRRRRRQGPDRGDVRQHGRRREGDGHRGARGRAQAGLRGQGGRDEDDRRRVRGRRPPGRLQRRLRGRRQGEHPALRRGLADRRRAEGRRPAQRVVVDRRARVRSRLRAGGDRRGGPRPSCPTTPSTGTSPTTPTAATRTPRR